MIFCPFARMTRCLTSRLQRLVLLYLLVLQQAIMAKSQVQAAQWAK